MPRLGANAPEMPELGSRGEDRNRALTAIARLFTGDAPDECVYRNAIFTWFSVSATVAELLGFAAVLVFLGQVTRQGSSGLVGALVGWAAVAVTWTLGVTSAVRLRQDGLIVDSGIFRRAIPWERFEGIEIDPSIGMAFSVCGGPRVRSVTFGRSLAGSLAGYKFMRAKRDIIMQACQRRMDSHQPVAPMPRFTEKIHVRLAPLAIFLAWFEISYILSYLIRHLL